MWFKSKKKVAPEPLDGMPRTSSMLCAHPDRCSNVIITAKYGVFSFLPLVAVELLHPFKRFHNFYFFVVGLLQMVPEITITRGVPNTWLSLLFIMGCDMVLIAREDKGRHRADRQTNEQQVDILSAEDDGEMRRGTWADVRVGDVIKVYARESFPADMLLLRASDPPGQAWINTKPLDGETDTKLRLAPRVVCERLEHIGESAQEIRQALRGGVVRLEAPNDKVNDFTGQLSIGEEEPVMLSRSNVLLRGCQLRNPDWVLGLVLSTGVDTKIHFSEEESVPVKPNHTMQLVNTHTTCLVILLAAICLGGSFANMGYVHSFTRSEPWYLPSSEHSAEYTISNWLTLTGTYFLLNYAILPVSLWVSAALVNVAVAFFMMEDIQMYDESKNERCRVRSLALADELGQVSHIFSDKTGTLTANHMQFRRCIVGGTSYGCGDTAISHALRRGTPVKLSSAPRPAFANCKPGVEEFIEFEEAEGVPSLFDDVVSAGTQGELARELMVAMATNHSVLMEQGQNGKTELCASSPDEQAFVAAGEYFGFEYRGRQVATGEVEVWDKHRGVSHMVEIVEVFPYESNRKRMSIIVRLPPELLRVCGGGCAERLYCKGADSVVFALLAKDSKYADPELLRSIDGQLGDWADAALRTLVWARRELPDFASWHAKYRKATANAEEVRKLKNGQPNAISTLQAEAESELEFVGATAIEDKLQDGVPEVLADLRTAGIKVWILTGDKVGTAKNIAAACNIMPITSDLLEITRESHPALGQITAMELTAASSRLESNPADKPQLMDELDAKYPALQQVRAALQGHMPPATSKDQRKVSPGDEDGRKANDLCLVLDETAMEYLALFCTDELRAVSDRSRSVIGCRMRKDQKAQMLNLIKEGIPGSCCLAVGDGANDVAMIKAGHIGVGIIGKEGMEAVNNSDFAIGQFRFLRSLLLVHGRFSYRRISIFCLYMFYKNIIVSGAMYFYSLFAMASGTRIFTPFFLEAHSIFYTSLPIIFFAINDMDVPKKVAAAEAFLYTPGIRRELYTHASFIRWIIESVYAAVMCVFVPVFCFGWPSSSLAFVEDGDARFAAISFTAMCAVIISGNLRLVLEMRSWTVIEHFGFWSMLFLFEVSTIVFSFMSGPPGDSSFTWEELEGIIPVLYSQASWWLTIFLTILLVLLPAIVWHASSLLYKPSVVASLRPFKKAERIAHEKLEGFWYTSDKSKKRVTSKVEMPQPQKEGEPTTLQITRHPSPNPFVRQISADHHMNSALELSSTSRPATAGAQLQRRRSDSDFAFSANEAADTYVLQHYNSRPTFTAAALATSFAYRLSRTRVLRQHGERGSAGSGIDVGSARSARSGSARSGSARPSPTAANPSQTEQPLPTTAQPCISQVSPQLASHQSPDPPSSPPHCEAALRSHKDIRLRSRPCIPGIIVSPRVLGPTSPPLRSASSETEATFSPWARDAKVSSPLPPVQQQRSHIFHPGQHVDLSPLPPVGPHSPGSNHDEDVHVVQSRRVM